MGIINKKNLKKKINNLGFSLLEILAVLSILGIILPATFSVVMVILRQQLAVYELVSVKQEGDNILLAIKEKIRSEALTIKNQNNFEECNIANSSYAPSALTNFQISSQNSSFNFYFALNSNALEVKEGLNSTKLHSNAVTVTSFTISCFKKTNESDTIIAVNFTVKINRSTSDPPVPSLNYQTNIAISKRF